MTRECATDFNEIKKYVDEYRISRNLLHPKYIDSLKSMHKCYFSAISWSAELQHGNKNFRQEYTNSNDDIIFRLSETVSDLGSSLFNWINGNYKTSRVMLRVSIENFIRAVGSLEDKSLLTEKNLYKVFDATSKQDLFNKQLNPLIQQCYETLHNDYKTLCADVHTATEQNMENLTSLGNFPAFDHYRSNSAAALYTRVSKNITTIFCIAFNSFFQKMYYRNKENILNAIPRTLKPVVNAPSNK